MTLNEILVWARLRRHDCPPPTFASDRVYPLVDEIDRLKSRVDELLEANNRYLERARRAEGALLARDAAPVAFMATDRWRAITARELINVPEDGGRRATCAQLYPIPLFARQETGGVTDDLPPRPHPRQDPRQGLDR